MRGGVRSLLVALAGALVLVLSPAALAGGEPYQLVTPNLSGLWPNCGGFVVESIDGTANGCTPFPDGVSPYTYSAASNGSIVFAADDSTSGGAGGRIWLVRPDGSPILLDNSINDFDPTISYDGSKVVFARFDPTTWSSDIYSVNSDGSDLKLVVPGGGTSHLTLPSISPDGSTIAYWCEPARYPSGAVVGCGPLTDGSYRPWGVMRVNVDGSDPRMIVIGSGDAVQLTPSDLSWSPDSQWLAMDGQVTVDLGNGEQTGQPEIFRYHADGSDLFDNRDPTRQLTHETRPGGTIFPQFSPDGLNILYLTTIDDNGNQGNFTYMIGVDGTNRRELPIPYGKFIPTATPVAPPPLVDAMHVPVPSVHALGVRAARSKLAARHLRVGKVRYAFSTKVRKNRVLSQRPRAGAVAHRTQKLGPRVNLVVSRGRRPRR